MLHRWFAPQFSMWRNSSYSICFAFFFFYSFCSTKRNLGWGMERRRCIRWAWSIGLCQKVRKVSKNEGNMWEDRGDSVKGPRGQIWEWTSQWIVKGTNFNPWKEKRILESILMLRESYRNQRCVCSIFNFFPQLLSQTGTLSWSHPTHFSHGDTETGKMQ